ncbi:MAG: hypothetical protein II816_08130 [Elusimicrobia bacterium]|nr:hypothetical protein [Elusimicrobiota bacterium]
MKKYFLLLFSIGLLSFLFSCNKQSAQGSNTIICFGDSLTKGYGAKDGKGYPYYLQKMVSYKVINLGVNGNTSADGLRRIDNVLKYVNSSRPIVIVEFGANDFFQQVPLAQTKRNIERIIDKLTSAGAEVVVASAQDSELDDIYYLLKSVAERKKVRFVDGILNEIWHKRDLFSDSVHPNSEGYKLVAEKIYKKLQSFNYKL